MSITSGVITVGAAILGVFATIFAVRFGFNLTAKRDSRIREQRIDVCWGAVFEDLKNCAKMAETFISTYLEKGITTPLYRLPDQTFRTVLPQLFGIRGIEAREHEPVRTYFDKVEALNRGFDLAQECMMKPGDPDERSEKEKKIEQTVYQRNVLYALELVGSKDIPVNTAVGRLMGQIDLKPNNQLYLDAQEAIKVRLT